MPALYESNVHFCSDTGGEGKGLSRFDVDSAPATRGCHIPWLERSEATGAAAWMLGRRASAAAPSRPSVGSGIDRGGVPPGRPSKPAGSGAVSWRR